MALDKRLQFSHERLRLLPLLQQGKRFHGRMTLHDIVKVGGAQCLCHAPERRPYLGGVDTGERLDKHSSLPLLACPLAYTTIEEVKGNGSEYRCHKH